MKKQKLNCLKSIPADRLCFCGQVLMGILSFAIILRLAQSAFYVPRYVPGSTGPALRGSVGPPPLPLERRSSGSLQRPPAGPGRAGPAPLLAALGVFAALAASARAAGPGPD